MKIMNIFHFGRKVDKQDEHAKKSHSERSKASPVAPDWMYQGSWTGGDGHKPPHDHKEYVHDYGYFNKHTEVAPDKAYRHDAMD